MIKEFDDIAKKQGWTTDKQASIMKAYIADHCPKAIAQYAQRKANEENMPQYEAGCVMTISWATPRNYPPVVKADPISIFSILGLLESRCSRWECWLPGGRGLTRNEIRHLADGEVEFLKNQ